MLRREKFRRYFPLREAVEYVDLFARSAYMSGDPPLIEGLTPDPGDDYLVCLARHAGAHLLVSGDPRLDQERLGYGPVPAAVEASVA